MEFSIREQQILRYLWINYDTYINEDTENEECSNIAGGVLASIDFIGSPELRRYICDIQFPWEE